MNNNSLIRCYNFSVHGIIVQAKQPFTPKSLHMITYKSQKQLTLEGFETPFEVKLDADNRWARLSLFICIAWYSMVFIAYKTAYRNFMA